jgi:hypothetical protein
MNWHYNTEHTEAHSDTNIWLSLNSCPWHIKVLLLTRGGVCVIGTYNGQEGYTHWSPLPMHERRQSVLLRDHERRMKILDEMGDLDV